MSDERREVDLEEIKEEPKIALDPLSDTSSVEHHPKPKPKRRMGKRINVKDTK